MKISGITFTEFCDRFRDMGRKDQFSYDGLRAIYDDLTEYENALGEEIDLDVIAICCEFSEYTFDELRREYFDGNQDITEQEIVSELRDRMHVLEVDANTLILQHG